MKASHRKKVSQPLLQSSFPYPAPLEMRAFRYTAAKCIPVYCSSCSLTATADQRRGQHPSLGGTCAATTTPGTRFGVSSPELRESPLFFPPLGTGASSPSVSRRVKRVFWPLSETSDSNTGRRRTTSPLAVETYACNPRIRTWSDGPAILISVGRRVQTVRLVCLTGSASFS